MITESEKYLGRPVYSLQTLLRELSNFDSRILPLIPDGIYGPNTYASIVSFQAAKKLPVTGNADLATWQAIVEAYRETVPYQGNPVYAAPGDSHHLLYPAQAMLAAISNLYPAIPAPVASGSLDRDTEAALKQIQKAAGLAETGFLDFRTYQNLQQIFLHAYIKKPAPE